jgi:uncharacterized repeat protein (TIGR03803 family)
MHKMLQWIPAILGFALLTVASGQSRAWTPKPLVSFNGADGATPFAGLIADAGGNLFGTTDAGGANVDFASNGSGTVFEIAKTAGGYASAATVLYSFCALANCADGANPHAGLIADANGNLFGTTTEGGTNYHGTVFEIAKTAGGYASTLTTLYTFCALANCADGAGPLGLVADANGNLFGTTAGGGASGGGAYSGGTVFEIAKTAGGYASTPTTLYSFCALAKCADGDGPAGGLIADANGNLFGTTLYGGAYSCGVVFEIAKTAGGYASTPTTLYSFCLQTSCAGANPSAGLLADANGNLFGTTLFGGAHFGLNGGGTVFEIAKTVGGYASTPSVLYSFCAQIIGSSCADGAAPSAGLIADANGSLFGTTSEGGVNNDGTVFEIAKTAGGYASTPNTVSFNGTNGADPSAGLLANASGKLYGTTAEGGANDDGTVFEIADSGYVTNVPFASLRAALVLSGGQHPAFNLDARLRLGACTDGINPRSEFVNLQIGPYAATIPSGSFRQLPAGKRFGVYEFVGKISNVSLALDIISLGRNSYQFLAAGTPIDPSGNRMPVSLRIGDDAGSTVASAERLP